jgi:hypothetical protein
VPRIYEAPRQRPDQTFGSDPFRDLGEALKDA